MNLLKNKIVLLGAGNVASHLGITLKEKGFSIVQVYSQTLESAKELGEKLNAESINDLSWVNTMADIYILSIKDNALPEILEKLPLKEGLFVHTAGSIPLEIFKEYGFSRYGVFYPLQTFSKEKNISFSNIPIFVEANTNDDELLLEQLAFMLSGKVFRLSSEKRKYLHLAAVFACNFVNHMYANAADILEKEGLAAEYLSPLIEETALKIRDMHPKDAQTGPAVRYDTNVINKHLELLNNDFYKRSLYKLISESINKTSQE